MNEKAAQPGILKTFATILGGSVMGGATGFLLTVFVALGSSKKAGRAIMSADGFVFAGVIGAVCAALVLVLGFGFWLLYGRKDKWLAEQVNELWDLAPVRFFGITLTSGAAFAVLFVVAEWSLATPEYPPKWEDFPEFVMGGYILSVLAYAIVALLLWTGRKLFGSKRTDQSQEHKP